MEEQAVLVATIVSFPAGVVTGAAVTALVVLWLGRQTGANHRAEIERYRLALAELREERAGDREVNRRLRHELAINTPANLREERDQALFELDRLSSELLEATLELEDRDRSLRIARQAIHEIRMQLEQDRTLARQELAEAGDRETA